MLSKKVFLVPSQICSSPWVSFSPFSPGYPLLVFVFRVKGPTGSFPTHKIASGFSIPSNNLHLQKSRN